MGNQSFHNDVLEHLQLTFPRVVGRAIANRSFLAIIVLIISITVFHLSGCAAEDHSACSATGNRSHRLLNDS